MLTVFLRRLEVGPGALTVSSTDFFLCTLLVIGGAFRTSVQEIGLGASDVDDITRAGTPLVPARACKPCVPPLREARYQSFMKWRSSRICAPAPTSEGRCSFAWWPQKYSWPPDGIVARTQARAPQASQRFAAVSCGSFSTGRSRVCAFMLPSHTITPPRAPLFTRGAIDRPHTDTTKRGSVNPLEATVNTTRNAAHQRDLAPASSIVESVPEPAPRAPVAPNEHGSTYDAPRDSYRRIRLQRTAPLGPRGA